MSDGTFKKVGKTETMLFGPRAMIVCGYAPEEQNVFLQFLNTIGVENVRIFFIGRDKEKMPLKELLALPDQTGLGEASDLDRTIILSGVTENELHLTISTYKKTGLPRPLWATLTPISKDWPLDALIAELKKERAVMEKGKRS